MSVEYKFFFFPILSGYREISAVNLYGTHSKTFRNVADRLRVIQSRAPEVHTARASFVFLAHLPSSSSGRLLSRLEAAGRKRDISKSVFYFCSSFIYAKQHRVEYRQVIHSRSKVQQTVYVVTSINNFSNSATLSVTKLPLSYRNI